MGILSIVQIVFAVITIVAVVIGAIYYSRTAEISEFWYNVMIVSTIVAWIFLLVKGSIWD